MHWIRYMWAKYRYYTVTIPLPYQFCFPQNYERKNVSWSLRVTHWEFDVVMSISNDKHMGHDVQLRFSFHGGCV